MLLKLEMKVYYQGVIEGWFVVSVRQVLNLVKVLGLAEGTEEAVFFRLDGVSMPKLVGSPFTFPLNPRQVFRRKSV